MTKRPVSKDSTGRLSKLLKSIDNNEKDEDFEDDEIDNGKSKNTEIPNNERSSFNYWKIIKFEKCSKSLDNDESSNDSDVISKDLNNKLIIMIIIVIIAMILWK